MDEKTLRAVMVEAYEMGVIVGELQMERAELRATIKTLNEKLDSLKTENGALVRKIEKLRGAEVTD